MRVKSVFLARSWTLEERLDKLRKLKCCLRCLKPGHFARDCKHFVQCHLCKRSHPIFYVQIFKKKCESVAGTKGSTTVQATMSTPSCMREVLPYDLNG
ncbi:hypothetical protein CEXT_115061 [Caerostris extrusa]|uniref:CCHC-type domain-containing protein n=1 Tax=Caerostris extrusa TaxID=172846 RepID=A0AAV4QL15_CAEEX|nr:hypothetical protein CEXT_115061 [Caerostris extrusa]